MSTQTAIVGAGISGLLLAHALTAAGSRVVVLEKSRGFGGRMATKRVGGTSFDHGAQSFTAGTPAFARRVEQWARQGLVREWPNTRAGSWIGVPSMTAVPKALSVGLDVRREHRVVRARLADRGAWELEIEGRDVLRAETLLFTCPVPQALGVLHAGQVALPQTVADALQAITYHPCLALLVELGAASALPPEGLALADGDVRWLADNAPKGLPCEAAGAVTIHASPTFSAAHFDRPDAEVAAKLLAAAGDLLAAPVLSTTLHRWRYSEPANLHPEPFVWLAEARLGFAGDGFGGGSVEGAALSGLALAKGLTGGGAGSG